MPGETIVYGFAPTTEDQTPYPSHARYGSEPVVAATAKAALGQGTPAPRWWSGMSDEEIYQNGFPVMRGVPAPPSPPFAMPPPPYWPPPEAGPPIAPPIAIPVNVVAPSIAPTTGVSIGTVLTVTPGIWTGATTPLEYQWLRGGQPIDDATDPVYSITPADAGWMIACREGTYNLNGGATALSNSVMAQTSPDVIWNGQVATWNGQNVTW